MSSVLAAVGDLADGRVLLAALALLAVYAAACWWWPFTSHGRCNGTGKLRSPGGKTFRRCPGCKGTGTKLRAGRRLFDATTTTRRRS